MVSVPFLDCSKKSLLVGCDSVKLVDVIIIRSNSIVQIPRVRKIAESLKSRYSVAVLGWNREGISKKIIENYIVELKLHNLKAPIGKFTLIPYLPLFWAWIFFKLIDYRPKIVHAIDLDTVIPCYLYKILFRKKLVFDVCDRFAMSRIPPKNSLLYHLVNFLEEKYCKKADFLVAVSQKLLDTIQNKPKKCAIVMNCPVKQDVDRNKHKNTNLILVSTGHIIKQRGLGQITSAIKDLSGVELYFAGRVIEKEFLDELLKMPNVKYKGFLPLEDAFSLTANSDVMVILYDLEKPINKIAMPNKIFEAMMFGLPIITNVASEIINECGCGIIVDYKNLNQIKSAIIRLRDDDELRKRLIENGKNSFEQKYNWHNVEKELFRVYENLFN